MSTPDHLYDTNPLYTTIVADKKRPSDVLVTVLEAGAVQITLTSRDGLKDSKDHPVTMLIETKPHDRDPEGVEFGFARAEELEKFILALNEHLGFTYHGEAPSVS